MYPKGKYSVGYIFLQLTLLYTKMLKETGLMKTYGIEYIWLESVNLLLDTFSKDKSQSLL